MRGLKIFLLILFLITSTSLVIACAFIDSGEPTPEPTEPPITEDNPTNEPTEDNPTEEPSNGEFTLDLSDDNLLF